MKLNFTVDPLFNCNANYQVPPTGLDKTPSLPFTTLAGRNQP